MACVRRRMPAELTSYEELATDCNSRSCRLQGFESSWRCDSE